MRISDWSSDVCSSDLAHDARHGLANSPLENRAPRHKTELMCPLDHGVTLVADHDGAAVDTLDRFAALRHDIPQSRFLLDLLTGPVELTLLKDEEQIATGDRKSVGWGKSV